MSTSDVNVEIDKKNDVLYVLKKETDISATLNVGVDADVTVRIDRRSHEVVGFTITDFSKSMFGRISDKNEYLLKNSSIIVLYVNSNLTSCSPSGTAIPI